MQDLARISYLMDELPLDIYGFTNNFLKGTPKN